MARKAAAAQQAAADQQADAQDVEFVEEGSDANPAPEQQERKPAQQVARKSKPAQRIEDAEADDEEDEADDEEQPEAEEEGDDEEFVEEIDYAELQRLRQEAKARAELEQQLNKLKADLKATSEKVKGYEREKLSEQEKRALELKEALDKATQLEAALKQARLESEITRAATELRVKPSLALKLVSGEITFDEEGKPANVETALRTLIEQHPELVSAPARQSPTNGEKINGKSRSKGSLTMADIEAMTEEEINSNWDAVQAVLQGQA